MFQQNQLEDVRTNITVWLTSLAMQVIKLKKLNHVLDEEYQITHILASLPKEYSSVVEQVKIDRRTSSTLITMDEIKKRLKERYLQLKKEHGWSEEEMALNVKSGNNQNKNVKKGNKGKFFKGRCNHCGKYGHKKADCWDLKNKKEKPQEDEKKVQKDKSKIRCYKCGQLGHYANECKNDKESSGGGNNETFAMTCFEEEEDNKNENGDDENKFESKNGSSGSDIVLIIKAISCSHSFKVLSSLTSANALISGLDPSACLVLAATGSLGVVWLLVLEATGSSLATPTVVSVGSSASD